MEAPTINMVAVECCNCGVCFAMPADLNRNFRESKRMFYCPNGHGQSYPGKPLSERLDEARRDVMQTQSALWKSEDRELRQREQLEELRKKPPKKKAPKKPAKKTRKKKR